MKDIVENIIMDYVATKYAKYNRTGGDKRDFIDDSISIWEVSYRQMAECQEWCYDATINGTIDGGHYVVTYDATKNEIHVVVYKQTEEIFVQEKSIERYKNYWKND